MSETYQTNLFENFEEGWEKSILSVEDFRVKVSQLLANEEDLKKLEELSSLKLQGSHLFSNPSIYSLRMSKDSSAIQAVIHSRPSSKPWMGWGTTVSGSCLTAKISEFHKTENVCSLSDILEENVDKKYFLSKEKANNIIELKTQKENGVKLVGNIHPSGNGMNGNVYDFDGLAPTLTTNKGEGPKIVQKPRGYNKGGEHEVAPTLSSNSWHENNLLKIGGVYTNDSESYNCGILPGLSRTLKSQNHDAGIFDGVRIRKLTPRECWRLQGFPDWAFDKAQEVNSNSQLYKQAGNSVTVPVIYEIARRFE